ncbi:MAG: glycoside hydrolase family 3 N-terminal domain-containing protein [Chitinophagaceae bacterium]
MFFITCICQAQPANTRVPLPKQSSKASQWVDSVYNSLSLDEKIGQLFMVAAYSGGEKYNQAAIENLIQQYHIGGLIFMQGTAKEQAMQTNIYQTMSKVPLLIGMDAEWGLGMRLKGIYDMPRQLMMGAMQDSSLVYKMASAVANQCHRLGVHINFAPVIDVNNNPNNPVINFRSFGEDKYRVAMLGIQYMQGLQDNGVIACAKHFPGHGDTDVDSHKDLPEIKKTLKQLEDLELYPFKKLIANGIQSIMVAHLQIPSLEKNNNTPTTLSYNTVTSLLKEKMQYSGLVITDALNMKGVTKYYDPGEIDLKAFLAGNDILLFSEDVAIGIQKIKKEVSEKRLAESVKKILYAKYQVGLHTPLPIELYHIDDDINQYTSTLRFQIAQQAVTLLSDPYQVLDKVKKMNQYKIAYLGIGTSTNSTLASELKKIGIKNIQHSTPISDKEIEALVKKYKSFDAVLVGIHNMSGYPNQNFGLDQFEIKAIRALSKNKNTLNILMGNPYALKNFCDVQAGFVVSYDEADETQQVLSKILNGITQANGKLPVSICNQFKYGDGITSLRNNLGEINEYATIKKEYKESDSTRFVKKLTSRDYTLECCVSPSALNININELNKLDRFLEDCVQQNAFPGCRILVAKQGKVFYDKSFGYISKQSKNVVDINTVYDLASVTKVAATTIAIMKLYDEGKIDLNDKLGKYLSFTKGTDKEYLKIKDILTHQAGLKSWIPFYKETLDSMGQPRSDIYKNSPSGKYKIQVCKNLYMRSDWIDTMWNRILYSPLENRGRYVYSDLDFIFLQKVVERITHQSINEYVTEVFYKPLGLTRLNYLPKQTMGNAEIAPSEYDNYFRYQTIQGYVHDMGAAMMGGVAGHAGLFSTANDLAVLFQMLLNKGVYNGKRYFKESTVDLFTAKNSFISRRGLGFDKAEMNRSKGNPCSDNASSKTFGHQGFTGTCVWADPQEDLVFVFLSNRTYPTQDNKIIQRKNVRETAQTYIYKALGVTPK